MDHAENAIQQIEISNKQAKEELGLSESLDALLKNKHFKNLIMEYYFKTYASSLVLNKADIAFQEPEKQAEIDKAITAVGELHQFFRSIRIRGNMARKALNDNDQMLEELLNGDEEDSGE